jgi:hypothetical protein
MLAGMGMIRVSLKKLPNGRSKSIATRPRNHNAPHDLMFVNNWGNILRQRDPGLGFRVEIRQAYITDSE